MNNAMKLLNNFKGAIFDLDGVLVDTEYYQWQGWVEVLKPFGISLSKEGYFNYAGKRGDIIEYELIKKYNLNIDKGSLTNKKESMLLEWFSSKKLELMPFAREFVEFFINKKFKIAICSGSPKNEVISKLKNIDLYSLFEIIIAGSDVERGKPFPDIYIHAIKQLKLKPYECIAFEDTQYGVESAKSAGLYVIAIPGEFSIKQDFSRADKVFKNLKEAIDWIKG